MSKQDFYFNSFALSTAVSTWRDPTHSSLTRVCKTAHSAVYDFYVKNPHDLTVGNCRILNNCAELQSKKTKLLVGAVATFGALYTLMLYGTTFHLQGRVLQAIGSKSGITGLEKIGKGIKKMGKKIFVSGGVPIYGLIYALPKHILTNKKIVALVNWIFQNIIQPLGKKVLLPLLQGMGNNIIRTVRVIAAITDKLRVSQFAHWIFKHVIIPISKLMCPILRALRQVIKVVARSMQALINASAKAASRIFDKLIIPAFHRIKPLISVLTKLAKVVSCIFNKVVMPIALGAVNVGANIQQAASEVWNQIAPFCR